jgi:DNA polymerase III alpha subunit
MINDNDITPLFYSDASGKSILTTWEEKECKEGGPVSIVKLAKDAGLKQAVYISSNFHDFVSALKNFDKVGIQMIFGLEILMCPNSEEKTDDAIKSNHKIIDWSSDVCSSDLFMKNSAGYKDLIKLYSKWKTSPSNKYYDYRFDYRQLRENWTDNLKIALPFFSSFLAANTLHHNCSIIPDFPTEDITIFRETGVVHPHKILIDRALNEFNKDGKYLEVNTKTCYYNKREDAKPWITFKSIQNRADFAAPQLEYLGSNDFCFESYLELTGGNK